MKRLLNNVSWVFWGILLGRILGYVRENLIATQFGMSSTSDTLQAVLTIPDIMLNLLVGGAVGAALMPEFAEADNAKTRWLHGQMAMRMSGILLGFALAVFFVPELVLQLVGSGFGADQLAAGAQATRWIGFVVPLTAGAAVTRSLLQSRHRFAWPSFSTVIYNIALVAGVWWTAQGQPLSVVAFAAIGGAALAWMVQLIEARRALGCERESSFDLPAGIGGRYVQAALVGLFILILPVIARSVASQSGDGAYSVMHYSIKMVELPLGVFLTILSVAFFPDFAKSFASAETIEDGRRLGRLALQLTWVGAWAVALPLALFAGDFASLLFGYGKTGEHGAAILGPVVLVLTIAMVAQSFLAMLTTLSQARKDTKSPLLASMIGAGVGVTTMLVLRQPLGAQGVAFGYSLAFVLTVISLAVLLEKRHQDRWLSVVLSRPNLGALAGQLVIVGVLGTPLLWAPAGKVRAVLALCLGLVLLGVGLKLGGVRAGIAELRAHRSGEGGGE